MLDKLKKALLRDNGAPSGADFKQLEGQNVDMSQLNELQAKLDEMSGLLESKTAELSLMTQEIAKYEAIAKEASIQAENARVAAEMAIVAERRAALEDVMGADNPSLDIEFDLIKNLDKPVFDLVINSKKAALKVEAESIHFNEVGASGEVDKSKVLKSAEMRILEEKYSKK